MAMRPPKPREVYRMIIEVKGPKRKKAFDEFKAEIRKIARKHGARIAKREHVIAPKKGHK